MSYSVTNEITNGNFVNTTGWNANASTISAASNTLSITGDGADSGPNVAQQTTVTSATGKRMYIRALCRVTNSSCVAISLYTYNGTGVQSVQQASPTINQWYTLSGVVAQTETGITDIVIYLRQDYADAATANGKVMQVQEVLAIDLTTLFGAGYEPTLTDCDAMFGTWFDGTQTMYLFSWQTPKTDWANTDYYNYGDVSRVEQNAGYIADYVEANLGNQPAIIGTKINWANSDIIYADDMERIESNVTLIKTRLGTPTGWGTPVTWVTLLKFDYIDANRLETNLSLLKTMAEAVVDGLLFCGDVIAGEGGTAL